MLQYLNGKTIPPKGHCGEIEKKLESGEKMPVINLEDSEIILIEDVPDELNTDQWYLSEMRNENSNGNISARLSQKIQIKNIIPCRKRQQIEFCGHMFQ